MTPRQVGVPLGRVAGIEVRAHASWFAVVALVVWSFWARFTAHGFPSLRALGMALAATALFVGSLLAHELAHALEGRVRKMPVRGITLFLFGGVTEMGEPQRPADQFALAAAGPFSSLVLGALFGIVATASRLSGTATWAEVFGTIGWLNVGLALFNLLPGAPLDGGRIVRSIAWRITGDPYRSARIAAWAGRLLGTALMALGLLQAFLYPVDFAGGLWLMFLGWYLALSAAAELAQARLRQQISGVPLREFVGSRPAPIPAGMSVAEAVDGWFRPLEDDAFLVADEEGRAVGLVGVDDIRKLDPASRSQVRVREAMRLADEVPVLAPDAPTEALFEGLGRHGAVFVGGAPGGDAAVAEDPALALLTPRTLLARLRRLAELEARPEPRHVQGRK